MRRPTLDDVFLALTGHVADATAEAGAAHLVHAEDIEKETA